MRSLWPRCREVVNTVVFRPVVFGWLMDAKLVENLEFSIVSPNMLF